MTTRSALTAPVEERPVPSMWQDAALVFRREFLTRIRSSMFLATLGFALVAIVGGILFIAANDSDEDIVGIIGPQPAGLVEALPGLAADAGFGTVEIETFGSRADLEAAIMAERVRIGVVDGEELVVKTRRGTLPGFLALVWEDARLADFVAGPDLDDGQRRAVAAATGAVPITELEPDPESSAKEGIGVALVVMLFLTIQLVGGMLLMSITEEKGNNIVELLLSSMSSRSLLLGKLAANGLLGLLQIVVLIGAAIIAVNVADLADLPAIPPSLLLVALVWFIIGLRLLRGTDRRRSGPRPLPGGRPVRTHAGVRRGVHRLSRRVLRDRQSGRRGGPPGVDAPVRVAVRDAVPVSQR